MRNKSTRFKGRMIALILLLSLSMFLIPMQNDISIMQAASGIYTENFTTTTYMDESETNATGWGTGAIENSKKKPTIVGSISSSLIGDVIDVFIDGNYAYVTNQNEGLKVVDISDPTNPNIAGSYDTPDIAQSVYIDGDFAFIADYLGKFPQYKNFLILNITDPTNPTLLGNCTTNFIAGDASRDVVVEGNLAYIANNEGGLSVINITDPINPERVAVRDTAGISFNVFVEGNFAYLADGIYGLVVINITNPLTPTIVASYNTGISYAIDVIIEGNYAYVAATNGLVVVDITNPTAPSSVGLWSKSGISDAYVYGDYLYITDINDGLLVVNITNPTTPQFIDSISIPGNAQTIVIDGTYAYIACQSGGFQVVRIADSSSPFLVCSYDTPSYAYDAVISGDFAYIADGTSGVQVLDISDPSSPTLAGSYDTPDEAWSIFVSGDFAYIADRESGLLVLNISDPSNPKFAGSYDTPDRAYGIFVSGDFAYIADGTSGLQVLDISDPSSPTLAGTCDTPFNAFDVFISGDFAYIADGGGLIVLDVSDPSSPISAGSYATLGYAFDVFVSGDFVYIADRNSGLRVVDISDPSNPISAGSFQTPFSDTWGIFVSGDFAYLADLSDGLVVLDVSDPSSPIFVSWDHTLTGYDIIISGDLAYLATGSGLKIANIKLSKVRQFASPCIAQSAIIPTGSGSYSLLSCNLISSHLIPSSTSITYYISADNGNNWENITPGVKHDFSSMGYQLKWKANLTTTDVSIAAKIYNLSITYKTLLNSPPLNTPLDGTITDNYTPSFTWSSMSEASEYLVQIDTTTSFIAPTVNITIPSTTSSYTVETPLDVDTYYWRVAAIDSEGDLGTFSIYRTLYIIQDTNAPAINSPIDVIYEQGSTGNNIIWTPSDSNPYWYNITLNSILTSHDDSWTGGNIVMDIDGLPLGIHTVVCYVYDLEGLVTSDTVEVEVTTTAPPTIDDVADFEYEEDSTVNSITWHPSDANPDYYSITREGTVIDDGPWLGGEININIDGLAYGAYTYICFVNDTEGQSNSDTVIVTVTDNVSPILNSPSDVIYDEGDTGNNIIWIASDNNPATYIVYRDGTQVDTNSWTSGSSIVISVDGLSAASYNYTIVVFDEAGNSAKDEVTVAVTPVVPEFHHSYFFVIASITIVIALSYFENRIYRKKLKK